MSHWLHVYLFTDNHFVVDNLESSEFCVKNVQVRGGYILHVGCVDGQLKVGDKVKCQVDEVTSNIYLLCSHIFIMFGYSIAIDFIKDC